MRAVAGAGTGSTPCCDFTVPPPKRSVEKNTAPTPSRSRPATAPTMSAIASSAPTSWKWIFSTGTSWIAASASPSRVKTAIARSFTRSGRREPRIIPRIVSRLRLGPCGSSAVSTVTCSARMPPRTAFSARSRISPGASSARSATSASSGSPQSSSAPRIMSPLAPEKQSKYATVSLMAWFFPRSRQRRAGRGGATAFLKYIIPIWTNFPASVEMRSSFSTRRCTL